jgi:ribosome maturation factor RimP
MCFSLLKQNIFGMEFILEQTLIDQKILPLAKEAAEGLGLDIVRIRMTGGTTRPTLQIMAERPDGTMDIGACEALSREVSVLFDVYDVITDQYVLEVSSPGIDRPLMRLKDYQRWVGFEAVLELHDKLEGRKRFRGRLKLVDGVTEDDCFVEIEDSAKLFRLPYKNIRNGRLVLTDDLIEATKAGKTLHGITADDVEFA